MKRWLFLLILIVPLAISVITSGVNYVYDFDELDRMHDAYLIATGMRPYADYYNIYSPVFPALLTPLFRFWGFTFGALAAARYAMVTLFLVRVFLGFILVSKLFGKTSGLLFILFLLLDPFTVFSAMQIRPDNLMMTIWTAALLTLSIGLDTSRRPLLILAGFLIAGATLTNVKLFPSLVILSVLLLAWRIKRVSLLSPLIVGFILTLAIFAGYFIATGTFGEMFQQMVLDPYLVQSKAVSSTYYGFFYLPDNVFIYGTPGKPVTWIYVWVLLIGGFVGAAQVFKRALAERLDARAIMRLFLVLSLGAQWLLLFFVDTIYAQYYLPVQWLLAAFAAVEVVSLSRMLRVKNRNLWLGTLAVFTLLLMNIIRVSIRANYSRATMDNRTIIASYERRWQQIPAGKRVFPHFLFRPMAYPLVSGYFVGRDGASIVKRYPPITTYLERFKVPYLLLSDYAMNFFDSETRAYIKKNYTRRDDELYVRLGISP